MTVHVELLGIISMSTTWMTCCCVLCHITTRSLLFVFFRWFLWAVRPVNGIGLNHVWYVKRDWDIIILLLVDELTLISYVLWFLLHGVYIVTEMQLRIIYLFLCLKGLQSDRMWRDAMQHCTAQLAAWRRAKNDSKFLIFVRAARGAACSVNTLIVIDSMLHRTASCLNAP